MCLHFFLLSKNPPTNVIALAANKCEPLKCHSAVPLNEVIDYANENKLIFMETSAKTSLNVQELFWTIGMFIQTIYFSAKSVRIFSYNFGF